MRTFRHALRSLFRTPLFTATAAIILSVSVGAAVGVFSLLHALVLRPIAVPNPHELVQLSVYNHQNRIGDLTWRQYREVVARQQVFTSTFASIQQGVFTVDTDRTTVRASMTGASGTYFSELGARAALGRLLEPSDVNEAAITGEPVVVLSWDFWQREYGGDASVIGRSLKADTVPLTIVGVAPKGFLGLSIAIEPDITVPITLVGKIIDPQGSMFTGTSSWVATTGRLKPGVTLEQARAQLLAQWPGVLQDAAPQQFRSSQREEYLKRTLSVDSGATGWERSLRLRYAQPLYVLQAIAAIVLLIAGANLCALIVTRAEGRRHELAMRLALGSSRSRLIRELTAEGVVIGIAGAAGGLALASFATDALTAFLLRDYAVRTAFNASPDGRVIAIAAAAGIGVAAGVTAAAAWLVTRTRVALTSGSRTVARTSRVGRVLVGAQVALSIVLLSHASLLTRSVDAIVGAESGFTSSTVLMASPIERVGAYRTLDAVTYYRQALERLSAVPGVAAVAFTTFRPLGGVLPLEPVGRAGTTPADGDLMIEAAQISPGFFATLEIPLLRGRDFTFADAEPAAKVAIISESLERQMFGEGLGLGQHLRVSRRPEWQDAQVVGVVRDARLFDVRGGNRAIAYTPALQTSVAHYKYVVARAPEQAARGIQEAIDGLGVEYITRLRTFDDVLGRTILQERVMAGISAFFGAIALLLVSVGIYGLLSYVLSLRRKEFGIRLALGARPSRIAGQVTGTIVAVTAIGVVVGLAGTALTAPLLRSVLWSTSPYDPVAISAASAILLLASAAAAAAPALRAARVQPVTELRRD